MTPQTTGTHPKAGNDHEAFRYNPTGGDLFTRHGVTTTMMVKRLPRLVRQALGLAWRIDRRAVMVLLACQGAAGVLEAFGLLAVTNTLTSLIAPGDIGDRIRDALPFIALLAVAYGVRALFAIAVTTISTRLSPRITREAQLEMLNAAVDAELTAYDHPAFSDRREAADRGAEMAKDLALVGENGSGKTTLSRLLRGLYLPTDGAITWDGKDTRNLDPHALWSQTALVPQDFTRWPMNARENITLGQPHSTTDAAVHHAATQAGADVVVDELRSGLDTLLCNHSFGGVELSGGQWQRIAIARAFYRRTGLLVMDEPTSALDARAEHRIFTGLREIAQDRAVVLVTHRLANVAVADSIVVLDRGRIIQRGTFNELVRTPGLFQELWELQNDRGNTTHRPSEIRESASTVGGS